MATAIAKEEELVSRIKAGDTESFNTLVKAYFPKTYRKVKRLVPAEDAEDVTQDIFLNLVSSIANFEGKSAFATWFNSIVVNRVADYHRRMFRYKSRFISEEEITRYEPSQAANLDVEMEDLLMKLPKAYSEVLLLKFCHNFSFNEIALALGLTYEATRSRYRRGVICAAKKMEPRTGRI
jgi:RNA polymerase sigma-70 factor (ECF subfamily)